MSKNLAESLAAFFNTRKKPCLLACSGGVDSMVLLQLMLNLKLQFKLAHVNYGLRGKESDLDQKLVQDFAIQNKLICHVCKLPKEESDRLKKGNLQEKAREIRYRFFSGIMEKESLNYLVLAHHQDDQIETFFINLARNAGLMGLSAMLHEHNSVLRPMLDFPKQKIREYAAANKIEFREDASNTSLDYARNKLRNEIIPFLKSRNAFPLESIRLLMSVFQENQQLIYKKTKPLVENFILSGQLEFRYFDELKDVEKIEFFRQMTWKPALLDELNKLRNSKLKGKFIIVAEDKRLFREENAFILENIAEIPELIIQKLDTLPEEFTPEKAIVDAGKLVGPISIRALETGDKMQPAGMKGNKLISKILKDEKIPSALRKNYFVVHDSEKIIWLSGLKLSQKALADENSTDIISLQINPER